MRRGFCLLFALLLAIGLMLSCAAEETDLTGEIDPEEGLTEEILESIGGFDPEQTQELGSGVLRLLTKAMSSLSGCFQSGLLSAGVMLAAVLLCSLLSELSTHTEAVRFAGVLAIVGACAGGMHSMITLAEQTLSEMREYSLLLLPGLASLSVFSGAATTGAAVCIGGVVFFDLLLRISSALILPLVWLYTACCTADAALGGERLAALGDFLHWLAATVLKWTSYLFTGYLAVTGILSGTADAIRLRSTRAALSAAVPLVGSIISDASESLIGAAVMLKSAAGVYGMLAVLAICLAPFLKIALQQLLLRGTQAVSGLFGQTELTRLIGRLSEAMKLLLALTGSYCLAALLSIVLCLKATGM